MNEFYINITYECNSNCVFCAAEHEIIKENCRLSLYDIRTVLEDNGISSGDEIIINGGEPTIHPHLFGILDYLNEIGCKIIIFTNGRRFEDDVFLEHILSYNISQLSIPIHGNSKIHNNITRVKGSYEETIKGLSNLKKRKTNEKVELKFVICKSNKDHCIEVLDEILSLNVADKILISSLFQTDVARLNEEIIDSDEILSVVDEVMNYLMYKKYNGEIVLYGIPLCLLESKYIQYIVGNIRLDSYVDSAFKEIYIDYYQRGNIINNPINRCFLKKCKMHNYCQCGDEYNFEMFKGRLRPFI